MSPAERQSILSKMTARAPEKIKRGIALIDIERLNRGDIPPAIRDVAKHLVPAARRALRKTAAKRAR